MNYNKVGAKILAGLVWLAIICIVVSGIAMLAGCQPSVTMKGDPADVCKPNTVKSLTVTSSEVKIECHEGE